MRRKTEMGSCVTGVVAMLLAAISTGATQGAASNPARAPEKTFALPFELGETLTFQVKLSRLILSGNIGRLTFSFDRSLEPPLLDHYMLRADAVSDGILPQLFGIEVHDVFDSFVSMHDFGVSRSRRQIAEGRRNLFELAVVLRAEGKVLLIKRDLAKPASPPQINEAPCPEWVQDFLAGIYYLRSQPLQPRTVLTIPVLDRGKLDQVQIAVSDVEELETTWGRVMTLRIEPEIFGKDNPVSMDAQLTVWVTHDDRHLPLLARLRGSFGLVTFQLKEIRGAPAPNTQMPSRDGKGSSVKGGPASPQETDPL